MITFVGHWPTTLDIPGTTYYVGKPFTGSHGHTHEADDRHDHSSHCHGDSASCSNVPSTAGVTFGLMSEVVALALAAGALVAVAVFARATLRENVFAPEPRPPRLALLSC
jgi:hypothetical protein